MTKTKAADAQNNIFHWSDENKRVDWHQNNLILIPLIYQRNIE